MIAAARWRGWGLLAAVSTLPVHAQTSALRIEAADACPTVEQLRERLTGPSSLRNAGQWVLKLTRPSAEVLAVELARDGQLVGRRRLNTTSAACVDVAQTVSLLVSSWLSAGAGTDAMSAIEQTIIEEPDVSVSVHKQPRAAVKPAPLKERPAPTAPANESPSESGKPAVPAPPAEPVVNTDVDELAQTRDEASDRAPGAPWVWGVRATFGAHWRTGWGMQGLLGLDGGRESGWGLRMNVKASTPVSANLSGGFITWWNTDASVGVRRLHDLGGVAAWEWAVDVGVRMTAVNVSSFFLAQPTVVVAPVGSASVTLRLPMGELWWLVCEAAVTAQPWEERWVIAGGGEQPVTWVSGAISLGVQRTFF